MASWALASRNLVKLAVHRVEQGHVLCSLERQLFIGIIMHHFRDAVEHSTRLVQCIFVVFGLSHYDMDTSLTRPGAKQKSRRIHERVSRESLPKETNPGWRGFHRD